MPSINMIAPRRAEKQRLMRDMKRLVLVILAQVVFLAVLGGFVFTKLITTRARVADLDVQLLKLQPTVRKIEENRKATARLQPKLKLLSQAKDSTMCWFNTLDRLTQSLPQSAYLLNFAAKSEKNKGKSTEVSLTGISPSQARVGEIMLRLNAIPEFRDVNLHFTQRTNLGDLSCIEFEIGATMKGGSQNEEVKQSGTSES